MEMDSELSHIFLICKSRGEYLYFVSITRKGHGMKLVDNILIKRYDHGMKLARTDYKPIDLNNPTDPLANRFMQIQENIHFDDFVCSHNFCSLYSKFKAGSHHIKTKSGFNPGREF